MSYIQQQAIELSEAVNRAPREVQDEILHIRFMIIALRAHKNCMTLRQNNNGLAHWTSDQISYVNTLLDTLIEALLIIQEQLIAGDS